MPTRTELTDVESALLQMAPDAMLVVDPSGRIVQANALAEALFGYPPGQLAGQQLDVLIPGRFREAHRGHAEGLFRRPQHRPMGAGPVLWGLRHDGSEFAAQITLSPLESPGGMHVLAAIRDVSEHLRNQAALEQATTDLERQVAARSAELLQANGELRRQIAEREQAETALRQTEAHYRQLVENQPDLICRFLPDTTLGFVNLAYARFFDREPSELIGQRFIEFLDEEDRDGLLQHLASFTPAAPGKQYSHRTLRADGVERWHLWHDFAFFDEQGRATGFQSVGVDITESKRVEEALFEAKERAQVTLHSIGDAVITTDGSAVVDYLNPVAEALSGWTNGEACGRPVAEVFRIVDEQTRQPAPDPVARCLVEGRAVGASNDFMLIGRNGQEHHIDDSAAPIRGRDGRVLGAVLVFHDVTETRRLTRQLEYDATHDALTGLINRAEFERRLERALAGARDMGSQHALCYIDLDQFKTVNDTAGHAAGDELLRQIKTVLSGMFRERDTLARIGGDEFGLLLEHCPPERAISIAQKLLNRIRDHRFQWEGRRYQIGASIGLVPVTPETQGTEQLLTRADVACYVAKELGRNRVHLYREDDGETTRTKGAILGAAGLQDALDEGRFRLQYQAIMPLGAVVPSAVRYEVLLRVARSGGAVEAGNLVLPAAFLPAAERYGLMGAIDRWVIDAAFRDYANGVGKTGAGIAINLSTDSLRDDTLLGFIESRFAAHGFAPERVCFEVSEAAAMQNLRAAAELMAGLGRHGSQCALDDFGSGLSSFHQFETLPVDYLKIDGGFVADMVENERHGALVAAINQMSHTLGISTIAEHAHSREIVDRLRELGVDFAQGYFLGRPAPWGEIAVP